MSTDPIRAALTRDDSAITACAPQIASEQSYELPGIATAIERVEALLAAGGPEPGGSDAIERIADIAFVLHERDVEASLCDALDAAVRELANANAAKQSNVQHVRQAAELLRDLSQRVADMVALLQISAPHAADDRPAAEATPREAAPAIAEQQASEDALNSESLDDEIPREGLFGAELSDDDEFARAVAELAASLPSLGGPVEAVVVTLRGLADIAAEEPTRAPEPDEANPETQTKPADIAAEELTSTPELDDAVPEMQSEADILAAIELGVAAELEEAVIETQHDVANLAADEPDLALQQQPPIVADTPEAIEQTMAQESTAAEIVSDELARDDAAAAPDTAVEDSKDDAVSNAAIASEGALSDGAFREALSGEALLDDADAPPQSLGLPGASPDHSLVNGHTVVSLTDADVPRIPREALSPPPSEAVPDSETALPTDCSPNAAASSEPKLPPPDEMSPPPADVAGAAISSKPPYDLNVLHHNGDDEPVQIIHESTSHDADEAIAETAAEVKEEPPWRIAESSQALLPELALVDPQDDPGDLFEPLSGAAPSIAAADLSESASESSASAAATDPLAAMRTLSAEELLALFT